MGPTEFGVLCPTCGLGMQECPGHMGHIELRVPVFNPMLFPLLYRLLRLKCFSCHRLRMPSLTTRILVVRLMLLDVGKLADAMQLLTTLAANEHFLDEGVNGNKKGKKKGKNHAE